MELRHLRYFVTLAEELHFGRAAQRLHISQPPLSLQIKALEKELGVDLFTRTTQNVQLSRAGKALLAESYRILERVERLLLTAGQVKAESIVSLSVGCISTVLFGAFPAVVRDLRERYPEITLTVQEVDTMAGTAGVRDGALDVALVRSERVSPPLRMQRLVRDRYIAAVPADHPFARRSKLSLKALASEPLITLSRQTLPRPHELIIASCLKAGVSPNIAYYSPNVHSQLGSVACGLGIALVPEMVRGWTVPGVVYRDIDRRIELPALSIVWNASSQSTALVALLDTLRSHFGDATGKSSAGAGSRRKAH